MSQMADSIIIAAIGLVLSITCSAFIAGSKWGALRSQLEALRESDRNQATKADLAHVREQLAEIKGMFRLELKSGPSQP